MPFPLLQDRLDLGVVVRSYNEPVRHLLWELFSFARARILAIPIIRCEIGLGPLATEFPAVLSR